MGADGQACAWVCLWSRNGRHHRWSVQGAERAESWHSGVWSGRYFIALAMCFGACSRSRGCGGGDAGQQKLDQQVTVAFTEDTAILTVKWGNVLQRTSMYLGKRASRTYICLKPTLSALPCRWLLWIHQARACTTKSQRVSCTRGRRQKAGGCAIPATQSQRASASTASLPTLLRSEVPA